MKSGGVVLLPLCVMLVSGKQLAGSHHGGQTTVPSRTDQTPDEDNGAQEFEFPSEDDPRTSPGRPRKLTKETVARLIEAITLGATYRIACGYSRVTYTWFKATMARGRADLADGVSSRYSAFYALIDDANSGAAVEWLRDLSNAGKDTRAWQASAWRLERRLRAEYGRDATPEDESKGQPANDVSVEDLVDALQETLRAKGVDVTLEADDVVRAYLRKQVGKKRLGVEPRDEPTEGDER